MEALDKQRIEKGRKRLAVTIGSLTLVSLIYAVVFWGESGDLNLWARFVKLNWTLPLMSLLMGAGVYQGSKPVRWIFSVLLVIALSLEVYLYNTFGMPEGFSIVFFVLMLLIGGICVYMVMVDGVVEDFLLYQRSKNYGEFVPVDHSDDEEELVADAPRKGEAALEEDADEYEEEAGNSPRRKKSSKPKSDWKDELGIFEEED